MPALPFYLVDAFTSAPFTGNPAAVCPLLHLPDGDSPAGLWGGKIKNGWPEDTLLQAMTIEHNQSETAFFVKVRASSEAAGPIYELRWFTTGDGEIDLCGHATLASAHVIFEHIGHPTDEIVFQSRFSGELRVRKADGLLTLDFPNWMPSPCPLPEGAVKALGMQPLECHVKRDYLFLLATEQQVRDYRPDFSALARLGRRVVITAPGDVVDFVSRFFNPNDSLPEDPVTGSAHSMLAPFWAARLGRTRMTARQLSARGGELFCELKGERVLISGAARTYLHGEIFLT